MSAAAALLDPSSESSLKVVKEDAAAILYFIPRMLEAWPRHPREGRTHDQIEPQIKLSVVHDWQRAEHVPWRCAGCFSFSHSDEAVAKRYNEPCTPSSGEFISRLQQVHPDHALSAGTCADGLLVFCATCGMHTTFVFKGLLTECPGPPKGGKRYTARKRLLDGFHPDGGKPLDDIEHFQALQRSRQTRTASDT